MRKSLQSRREVVLVVLMAVALVATVNAQSGEGILFSFNGPTGVGPIGGLTVDAVGNLYGTTDQGGSYGCGTAFELMLKVGGGWTELTLHSFNKEEGCGSQGGLVLDTVGNLYGTTTYGGTYGYGAVFELTPRADGTWIEATLHNFNKDGKDGFNPQAGVILDKKGNLYGTTANGGAYYLGAVFELSANGDGSWTEIIAHSFRDYPDGSYPLAGLIRDGASNLYGTTIYGGTYGYGTVFQLMPASGGGWTEKILHSFNWNGKDGFFPYAGMVLDSAGNLYGATNDGGAFGCGTVFELRPLAAGEWGEEVLHLFMDNPNDGCAPEAELIFGSAGHLYGTTVNGGIYGYGTVFGLRRKISGGWSEAILHSFGSGDDGRSPNGVTANAAGNLFGTTIYGGAYGEGTAFALRQ